MGLRMESRGEADGAIRDPRPFPVAIGWTQGRAYGEVHTIASGERQAMSTGTSGSSLVERDGLRLEIGIGVPAPGTVRVRYRLHNTGKAPLAVFDRGDRHAVLTGRQQAGAIGAPLVLQVAEGDVELRHVARRERAGFTGPTVPATPLALQLAPGAAVEGGFSAALPSTTAPLRRVRWCLGVAPFEDAAFFAAENVESGRIWQAGDGAVAAQQSLCTPWFDLATLAFAPL